MTMKMHTYSIAKFRSLERLDDISEHDFTPYEKILEYAINGFVDWHGEPVDVVLQIRNPLAQTLMRWGNT